MNEIVLVTLAIDTETGKIDPKAPFLVNSCRCGTLYNRPYEDEPGVIEQFRPGRVSGSVRRRMGRCNGRLIFGKRVDDA
jgi:hypothetical protein